MKNKKIELSNEDKNVLILCKNLLDAHYKQLEEDCRKFKWICHKHLHQVDTPENNNGYSANKNVFDIQDKTIADIKERSFNEIKTLLLLINNKVTIEIN